MVSASPEFTDDTTAPGPPDVEVDLEDLNTADEDREPPLIGQADAAQAIQTGVERSFTVGSPTLVAFEGPRGSGKTRLLVYASEIAARIDERVSVHYGACREGGDGPYAPFSRLLLERFGVTPASSPSAVRAAMSRQVSEALQSADAIRVSETTHLLGHLAGIPFPHSPVLSALESDPQELHRRACRAFARLVEGDAQSRPVLMLLDNMQFAEETGWDLVKAIAAGDGHLAIVIAGDAPVLERAGRIEAAGGVALGPIAPLGEMEVQAMLHVLLPSLKSAPETLVAAVTHRSDGNPSAVRELGFALWEAGLFVQTDDGLEVDLTRLEGDDLPVGMEDAMRARLTRVDALERATLDRAAIVGEVFWDGAILGQMRSDRNAPGDASDPLSIWPDDADADALVSALVRLQQKGFVEALDQSDLPGATEYTFSLEGTRALLYAEIEDEVRTRRHAAVARWLGLVGQVRREGVAAMIAPHLEKAGQHARAGRAYLEAATYEHRHRRIHRALRYIERALEQVPAEDVVRRIEALHEHGSMLATVGRYDESIAAFTEMLRHAWNIGARGKGGAALNRIARAHRARGEDERAQEVFLRALELFRAAGDLRGVAATLDDLAQVDVRRGELELGFAHANEALEIRRAHADERGEAVSLNTLGQLEYRRGHLDAAESFARAALELRERIGDAEGALQSSNTLGVLAYERGDRAGAVLAWRSALERAREIADRRSECFLLNNVGEARLSDGAFDEAAVALERALEVASEIGDVRSVAEVKRNLGLLALRRGDEDATTRLESALDEALAYGGRDMVALAHRALGESRAQTLFSGDGEVDKRAEESFLTSIDLFRAGGNEREAARSLMQLGGHLVERGDRETAGERLREARAIFRRLGHGDEESRVDVTLRELGQS